MLAQRLSVLNMARAIAAGAALFAVTATAAATPTADDIWKQTAATYAALKSYSDTGVVHVEMAGVDEKHAFTTRYVAPRTMLFDFVKHEDADRFVIWSDAEAFHTWWKTTQMEDEYPKGTGTNAFAQSEFLTAGSALKVLPLIFADSGLAGALTNAKDFQLDGSEKIGGRDCHRLAGMTRDVYGATGREVNVRPLVVWVDKQTFLVRQVYEGPAKGMPAAQAIETTTTFEPKANPKLEPASLQFEAPTE